MLKEIVQLLMKDLNQAEMFKNGKLQFAGISPMEHRALQDVLNSKGNFQLVLWGS
ncbi:competence pheromone ComX [Paenibacillus pini]|uniref:ComX pheromone n=1 Tax=Paenibacillus pini JCM 16418 TaxID=1236976 RepID=W7YVC7_9BACL|nr:competence pheromone ComX [Paenibacillus pini]GAF06379.1 hypothetical protein JCM16418_332 [Paenibacillus pini JCM 16418]